MKRIRAALSLVGLMFLSAAITGIFLPRAAHAVGRILVDVVNTPNVKVANTPNVSIANTPNVNVVGQAPVSVSSMPPVSVAALPAVVTFADLYPFETGSQCYFNSSTECVLNDAYDVPSGFTAYIKSFNAECVADGGTTLINGQVIGQYPSGTPQTLYVAGTTVSPGAGYFYFDAQFGANNTTFYAAGGTSLSVDITDDTPQTVTGHEVCLLQIAGYLVPSGLTPTAAPANGHNSRFGGAKK